MQQDLVYLKEYQRDIDKTVRISFFQSFFLILYPKDFLRVLVDFIKNKNALMSNKSHHYDSLTPPNGAKES